LKLIPDGPDINPIQQRIANQWVGVAQSSARQRIRVNTPFDRHLLRRARTEASAFDHVWVNVTREPPASRIPPRTSRGILNNARYTPKKTYQTNTVRF
jgi:hypothetical protein